MILFDQWNNAIETKDPDTVTELYADDAILLPTLSNTICNSHEKIKNYFITFLKKGPSGVINESNSREFSDLIIHSGIYTFSFEDQSSATARFSYVHSLIDNEWKIIEHHSSLLPESR